MTPLTDEHVAALHDRHRQSGYGNWCQSNQCKGAWPCPTARVLAERTELKEQLAAAERDLGTAAERHWAKEAADREIDDLEAQLHRARGEAERRDAELRGYRESLARLNAAVEANMTEAQKGAIGTAVAMAQGARALSADAVARAEAAEREAEELRQKLADAERDRDYWKATAFRSQEALTAAEREAVGLRTDRARLHALVAEAESYIDPDDYAQWFEGARAETGKCDEQHEELEREREMHHNALVERDAAESQLSALRQVVEQVRTALRNVARKRRDVDGQPCWCDPDTYPVGRHAGYCEIARAALPERP
jgi:hypothetical protein